MHEEFIKIKLSENSKETIINDYGVYNFFNCSDNVYPCSFVAAIVDGVYYTNSGRSNKYYHNMLLQRINSKYCIYKYFVMGYSDKIGIWKKTDLDDNEIVITLGILNEVKKYCEDFKVKKMIYISIGNLKKECCSDNLDILISIFENLSSKNIVKKKTNK